MAATTAEDAEDVYDATPDFVLAVSLLAALEGAIENENHAAALPYLGLARAELVDFGQRRPTGLIQVEVDALGAGLRDLDSLLTALLSDSEVLQQALRLEAARGYVRRAIAVSCREAPRQRPPYGAACSGRSVRLKRIASRYSSLSKRAAQAARGSVSDRDVL